MAGTLLLRGGVFGKCAFPNVMVMQMLRAQRAIAGLRRVAWYRDRNQMSRKGNTIVVIGAGIGGPCAAVYEVKSGYRVVLVEIHTAAGGLATSWTRGQYTFETCISNDHSLVRGGGVVPARFSFWPMSADSAGTSSSPWSYRAETWPPKPSEYTPSSTKRRFGSFAAANNRCA